MKLSILAALNAERANRRAAVVVTDVASGEQRLVKGADIAIDALRDLLEKRIRSGKSGMEEPPAGNVFLTVYVPPPRLVVVSAGLNSGTSSLMSVGGTSASAVVGPLSLGSSKSNEMSPVVSADEGGVAAPAGMVGAGASSELKSISTP